MSLRVLDTGKANAQDNMDMDSALLKQLVHEKQPLLHFYDWNQKSATYGYFLKYEEFFHSQGLLKHQVDIAKRPTGGGIIFHCSDFAFSLLIPSSHPAYLSNTLDSYYSINTIVKQAIIHFLGKNIPEALFEKELPKSLESHFCMAHPTKYDILLSGRKIGGAAQRRTQQGILHQGSIFLGLPSHNYIHDLLKDPSPIISAIEQKSTSLLERGWTKEQLIKAKKQMRDLLVTAFEQAFSSHIPFSQSK